MDNHFRLRPAHPADLDALAALEKVSFSDPWTSSELRRALGWSDTVALVAEDGDGLVVGYILCRMVLDEGEVLTIAIEPAMRRAGIGRGLLDAALQAMRDRGVRTAWLEVRKSNAPARALYANAGFVAAGLRRGYYRRPPEDALVLRVDLTARASSGSGLR
jgi:[ribosomal protein S18]-alanine N-acetyltransferase